jgi:1-acyl-sn-glycerol-3-phosphate acyltransferase
MIFYFECVLMIVLLCFMSNKIARYTNRSHKYIKRLWLHLTMSALFVYFPKPLFIYYDPRVLKNTKNIIISNHLTEFDWLMVLAVLYKLGRYDNVCIVLKKSLKNIPLLGYGMKYFGFIFLNRRIEKDREIINEGVSRLKDKECFDLLLFPEGTYLDSESSKVTLKYIKNNPVVLDKEEFIPSEVLVPRVTGFNLIRETLKDDEIDKRDEMDKEGQKKEPQNKEVLNKEPQNKEPQNKEPQNKEPQNKEPQNKEPQNKEPQNKEGQKRYLDGVIDITMLVSPYTKYPQDVYTYTRTLTDFNDRIGFSFFIDYVEDIKDEDFVYRRFKIKDKLIKKYKEEHKDIKNMKDFHELTRKLNKEKEGYIYDKIYIQSRWGPIFYTIFLFSAVMKFYILRKIFYK